MIHARIKHFVFTFYWLIALLGFIAVSVWFLKSEKGKEEITIFLTIVGGLLSAFYFIQKQQHEELELFKDLFSTFNSRYDQLNEELNRIAFSNSREKLLPEEKNTLNNYFNLCAEEYLFYIRGYIYPEVWRAWHNGMKFYLNKDERIKNHWIDEKKSDSYYGLVIKYE
jgi:hypothetical protein